MDENKPRHPDNHDEYIERMWKWYVAGPTQDEVSAGN